MDSAEVSDGKALARSEPIVFAPMLVLLVFTGPHPS
jgi:hypothetical protein